MASRSNLASMLIWVGILFLSPLVSSLPKPAKRDLHRRDWEYDGEPCGAIFRWAREDLDTGHYPVFPAYITYRCLASVPFNAAVALRFIDYFNTTMQFHSTLAYLRDPPTGYQRPPVDVMAELDKVRAKVLAGSYTREYDFEVDIKLIVSAIHDGHVELNFGILSPFAFGSLWEIVSASADGVELPKPYLREDITMAQNDNWTWTPSPISTINDVDAVEYLRQFAANHSDGHVEAHADYNMLFEHPASDIQLDYGIWSGQAALYPGDGDFDWLDIKLENGTEYESEWWAELHYFQDPGPLETGGDMYNFFVLGLLPASYNGSDAMVDTNLDDALVHPNNTINGTWWDESWGAYPRTPDVAQKNISLAFGGVVTGYFLDDISTGVLSLPTFTQFGQEVEDFSEAVQEFIDKVAEKKLTRVVIDLQQNTGGQTKLAFDTFKRFFPKHDIFAGSRRRSHPLADVIGEAMTNWWLTLDEGSDAFWEIAGNEWVVPSRINAKTGENFEDWADFDAHAEYHGDLFSSVERYNLSDHVFTYAAFSGYYPYGFGNNSVLSEVEVFAPENIVLLTDGLCSSACSIFVEAMTRMGVRTLAVGGEPQTGPMQAVSGSRGARAYTAVSIDDIMAFVINEADPSAASLLPTIPPTSDVREQGILTHYLAINLRDQIRSEDLDNWHRSEDQVPLQFRYEAADCRLFYTLRSIYNMTQLWRDVAIASFDDPARCVADSTGYSSRPGTPAPLAPPPIPKSAYANLPTEPTYDSGELDTYGGPPPFDDGDLVSIQKALRESEITPCSTAKHNKKPCDHGTSCVPVRVACHPGKSPKPGLETIELCLPDCHSAKDDNCRKYDNEQALLGSQFACDAFARVNTKERGRASKKDTREKFMGLCMTPTIKWPGTCA